MEVQSITPFPLSKREVSPPMLIGIGGGVPQSGLFPFTFPDANFYFVWLTAGRMLRLDYLQFCEVRLVYKKQV